MEILTDIIIYGCIGIVILYIISIYNYIVQLFQRYSSHEKNLQNFIIRIKSVYEKLIDEIEASGTYEKNLTKDIVKLREKIPTKITDSMSEMSNALMRIEQYPDIKTLGLREKFQNQISSLERELQAQVERTNKTISEYNTYIQSFPNVIFCSLWNKVNVNRKFIELEYINLIN